MARTYASFVTLIRDWSNKDSSVVDDTKIKEAMRYAADTCYRKLRVSALEQTVTYSKTQLEAATTSASNSFTSKTEMTIPADLIEFIQLREIDDDGRTCRVFNEKTDLRTFNDWAAEKTQSSYWTRVGNVLLISPAFLKGYTIGTPAKVELHYYKRLPALDAKYDVTPANFTAGYLTEDSDNGTARLYFIDGNSTAYTTQAGVEAALDLGANKVTAEVVSVSNNNKDITIDTVATQASDLNAGMALSGARVSLNSGAQPVIDSIVSTSPTVKVRMATGQPSLLTNDALVFSNTNSKNYVGNEVSHWLRDENEKILLYGSLAEVFTFVQDDEQADKYQKLFYEEIGALNDEDNKRGASGGNVQINFNGRGLI